MYRSYISPKHALPLPLFLMINHPRFHCAWGMVFGDEDQSSSMEHQWTIPTLDGRKPNAPWRPSLRRHENGLGMKGWAKDGRFCGYFMDILWIVYGVYGYSMISMFFMGILMIVEIFVGFHGNCWGGIVWRTHDNHCFGGLKLSEILGITWWFFIWIFNEDLQWEVTIQWWIEGALCYPYFLFHGVCHMIVGVKDP